MEELVKIPFNKPFVAGKELYYMAQAVQNGHLSGDGPFTGCCSRWLEEHFNAKKVLLTHSCTAALEMAAFCAIFSRGEFIVPSYTFVSTANALVLRGGVPVFVDIRPDTMNIDESLIEPAITPRTRVIVPVHYAGVGCDMDVIMDIARRHRLLGRRRCRPGSLRDLQRTLSRDDRPPRLLQLPRDQEPYFRRRRRAGHQ